MVMLFCIVASGTVTNFFPTVVQTLGYSPVKPLLLTVPPYVLCVITTYLNSWHADRTGERYLHVILPLFVAVIAFIMPAATTSTAPGYVAMMLGVYTSFVVGLAWVSNTLGKTTREESCCTCRNQRCEQLQQYLCERYVSKISGPRYTVAMSVNCCTAFVAICAVTVLRIILVRLNKKLDEGMPLENAVGDMNHNGIMVETGKKGFRFKV
jgi:MFS family permease